MGNVKIYMDTHINYKLKFRATYINQVQKKAMVIDFSDLKSIVKKVILDPMDHAFIYDQTNERESQIATLLQKLNSKNFWCSL